jgi:hypothetical protein
MTKHPYSVRLSLAITVLCVVTAIGIAAPWNAGWKLVFASERAASAPVAGEISQATADSSFVGLPPLVGTYNIPGDYATLNAAITDLNLRGVGGAVTLNVIAGNPQTAPAGGYVVGGTGSLVLTSTSVGNTVTIQGNGNTITAPAAQTVGNLNDAIFKLIGADFITISGFTMVENPANTVTTAGTNDMTEWGVALLYVTATDGAQNNTIRGNTIDLNRTYQNTFGIYSNNTHTATAVTTAANSTGGLAGTNSGMKIYANTITDVNQGIVIVGSANSSAEQNDGIEVGGSVANANTITNFGTTATFSGYANVSGTVNGILIRNSKNVTVSNNSITSSVGGVTSGTLNGIQFPAFSQAPTGTFTQNVNNNSISLQAGAAGSAVNGINILGTSASATSIINVNNNDFNNFGHTVAGTAAITFITQAGTHLTQSISNNTFTNMTVNTTGSVTFISNTNTLPAGGLKNVNNNSIVTGFSKTGAGGTITCFTDNGSDPAGAVNNSNNNTFANITITGATTVTCISNTNGGSPTKTVSNNVVSNITGGTTGVITGISINFDGGTTTANGNMVSDISNGGAITGISFGTTAGGTTSASGNQVNGLNGTGTGAVTGILVNGSTGTRNIFKNKIHSLENGNAAGLVNGILVSTAPTTANIYNNLIGDLRAPIAGGDAIRGFSSTATTASTTLNVSFNTVYLNATSTGTNFSNTGIFHTTSSTATTTTLNLRDNIVVNLSAATGTGTTVAYRRSNSTLTNYGSVSNNNLFYAGTPGPSNLIYADGTNSLQTLAAYKALSGLSPRDSASVTENPSFVSTSGSNANFLHINTMTPTQIESGGIPVAGIADDFDGDTRNATTPDIGADEFTGIAVDLNPPNITYTPFANTSLTTNRTLASTITDPSGVAGGSLSPRIYFRKNAGSYVSTQCTGMYSCVIDYSMVGGVVVGDMINYFVIAQDTAGNVGSNPSAGLVASDVNTVTTPPTTPNSYSIITAIPSSVNVGSGETYTSLSNNDAAGLFLAINNGVLASNVTINITSDLTTESGAVALNEWAEDSAGGYTLTIKPSGGARTISGGSTNSIIRLNGADRVTIDGSLSGGTATGVGGNASLRNLTVQNTSTAATAGAVIAVNQGPNSANNVTIKNVIVSGQDPTQTLVGIHVGGNTVGTSPTVTPNTNVVIDNCAFKRSFIAIFNNGVSAAAAATGTVISHNDITATGADRMRRAGIFFFNQNGIQVTENAIGGIAADESADAIGIIAGVQNVTTTAATSGGVYNAIIAKNRISGVTSTNTVGFSAVGIAIAGDPLGENFIGNNMISGTIAPSTSPDLVAGIFVAGVTGSNTHLFYNSVANTGDRGSVASQIGSYGIAISGTNPVVELKDNIFYTTQTSGGGANAKSYAIGMQSTTFANLSSNYNDFFASGANAAGFRTGSLDTTGTDIATLSGWQAATSGDANSISVDPLFVNSATNLHIQSGSPAINAGTVIGLINDDIDGDMRGTMPDIGADEFVPPNTSPTIMASAVMRQAGSPGSNSTIATVSDAETPSGSLVVTVTSANPSNGVTVSNIVNTNGTVTADVVAACGATNASFTLQVSDGSLTSTDTLNVTVAANAPPTLTYANATVSSGGATTINPATGPTDNGSVTTIVVQSAGTYTGNVSVNSMTGVVSISNAAPAGMHTITIRATDNCGVFTDASFTLDVQAPSGGPVTVTATAGTTGPTDYVTLKAAIDAVNAGTHQGAVTVSIVTNTTETAPVVVNASGAGSASYTSLLIRPVNNNVTVSGATASGRGLIELNGADNVTIDGDNPNNLGSTINRNLTLQNTAANTTTFTSVIRVALNTTTVTSADNNVFKNLNIVGSSPGRNIAAATSTTGSENTTFGIFLGPNASGATTDPTAITSVTTGIGSPATANNLIVNNNRIITAARAVSINGTATTVAPGLQITGNSIGNPTVGDVDQVTSIGITEAGSANAIVSGNTIYVEGYVRSSTATHGVSIGLNSTGVSSATVENNFVNRVQNNDLQTWSAMGINLAGGNGHVVRNNFVSGVINNQTGGTGAFGTTFGAYGIRVATGTGHVVQHNSVHLYGPMPGVTSTNLTCAFMIVSTTSTGMDVRNNIFSNQISGGNPTGTRNPVLYLPSAGTSAMNLTLNNNAYYAGTDSLNRLAQVGSTFGAGEYTVANFDPTNTTPASNFRAYTSTLSSTGTNDNASFAFSGAPPFVSNSNLHIPDMTATPIESRGAAVGITTDIDGQTRNASTPDIGADEFNGVFVTDFLPPAMSYTPFGNTSQTTNRTLSVVITDATGVPTSGMLVPRIYFNKNGGAYSSTACALSMGTGTSGTWNCTVDYSAVGGVTAGDVVRYFTIAQDTAMPFNIGSNPGGVSATDVNTVSSPPPSPNVYTIVAAVPTSINVGTGQTYTSLTNAGGVFEAINAGTLSGNTTVNITSDLTAETGAVVLNQFSEDGIGGYTLTFKPSGTARIISGTSPTSTGLININGADRVVFDGSLSGGTDRSLTITNNQTGLSTVIWIRSASSNNGASSNTVKNCIINGALVPFTAQTTAGILAGSGVTLGNAAEAPNNNNTITNNLIYRVQNAIYNQGNTGLDQNWTVSNNEFGSSVDADKNRFRGMLMGNTNNFVISGNNIHGVTNFTGTTGANTGIQLAFSVSNGMVVNNRISDIHNLSASGTGAFGMQLSATPTTNIVIANNFIWDVQAVGSATVASNGHGITINGAATAGGYKIFHNSINMNTNQTSGTSAALNLTSAVVAAGALDARNNIFANTQTSGATRYGVYSAAANTVFSTIDYNDYFSTGSVGFIGGSARATLADWQAGTGQDVNSKALDPMFVSSNDLHIFFGSPMINMGGIGTGITTDIDGQTRDMVPDIGADEVLGNPGTLQFSSATYSANENGVSATITVTRTGGTSGAVGVSYATSNGTATGGASCGGSVDYVTTSGMLAWADGDSAAKTFNVTICDDAVFEGDETLNLALSMPTGGAPLGTPNTAVLTIIDNDTAPGTFSVNDVRVFEGNSGTTAATFTVTYAGTMSPGSVQYATANGTAVAGVDYAMTAGTLNFPSAGTMTVTVLILGDAAKEANETFFVNLSSPVNGTITDGQGVGIIIDDDRTYVSDFDRDLKSDVAVYRPSEGQWYILRTTDATPQQVLFGISTDTIVPGDYDGDGKTDVAVWRASTGTWYIINSSNGSISIINWGQNLDVPVQGDYDGDGKTDLAVFRPSTATWWILRSSNSSAFVLQFGLATDTPVQGDYDGDAKTDIAVFRSGVWYILRSTDGQVAIPVFGSAGDRPVSGDFDGDGKYDLAIFRNGDWWISNSLTGTVTAFPWGTATDIPAPADYDRDGTTDVTVFRPSTGDWYILRSSNSVLLGVHWGQNGDIPVASKYIP